MPANKKISAGSLSVLSALLILTVGMGALVSTCLVWTTGNFFNAWSLPMKTSKRELLPAATGTVDEEGMAGTVAVGTAVEELAKGMVLEELATGMVPEKLTAGMILEEDAAGMGVEAR